MFTFQKIKGSDTVIRQKKLLFQKHNNEWEPVTTQPVILNLTTGDFEGKNPQKCEAACCSQTVAC